MPPSDDAPERSRRRAAPDPVRDPARIAHAYRRMLAVLTDGAELSRVATTAARLAAELLRADGAAVTRMGDGYLEYVAGTGVGASLVGRVLGLDDSFTGRVARRGQSLVFDPRTAPNASADRARGDDICSGVVCPILVEGRVAGTIGAASRRVSAFDEESVERLRELAEFVALGLERARGQRRVEQNWHFARQSKLAAQVVARLEAPLGDLLGALVQLRDDCDPADTSAPLTSCFGHAETISRVLDELRTFAADDATEARPVGADLVEAASGLAEYFRKRAEALGEFVVELPDEPVTVLAAPGRLWQIGHALLSNAIEAVEARPRGMHRVRLSCRARPFAVELVVEDSGEGISGDDLPLIFEPFFSTRGGRAGLGLTLVWRGVSALGGTVDVDSAPGRGCIVTLRLPRLAEPRSAP